MLGSGFEWAKSLRFGLLLGFQCSFFFKDMVLLGHGVDGSIYQLVLMRQDWSRCFSLGSSSETAGLDASWAAHWKTDFKMPASECTRGSGRWMGTLKDLGTMVPRESKYPILKDSGPKYRQGYGFWDQGP